VKRMRRVGITGKLVFSAACILAGLGLAVTWHSVTQLRTLFHSQVVRRVDGRVLSWIDFNNGPLTITRDPKTLTRLVHDLKQKEAIAYVMLELKGPEDLTILEPAELPRGLAQKGDWLTLEEISSRVRLMTDGAGRHYFELTTPITGSGTGMNQDLTAMFALASKDQTLGSIRVGIDQAQIDRGLAGLVRQNVLLYGFLVAVALLVNAFLARRMARPIISMARVATQIAAGNLSGRVRRGVHLTDEVGDLVRNFNQMAERLSQNRDEMNLLYAGLEEKVRERTLELEQANSQLQQLGEMKSQFLSTVSHELRSPLTSIKAFAQILLDTPTDEATRRRFLDIIDKESDRLSRLISDLLDLAKIEKQAVNWRSAKADISELLVEAVGPLASLADKKNIRLDLDASEAQPVLVDTDRVQQVFTNLIGNAIKFSPPHSLVKIRLGRTPSSGPHRAAPGEYVRVSVMDEGPGIPPEEHERIFEKFFQSSRNVRGSGTGRRLALSRVSVNHHAGEKWGR
jgi:signal transduction histidine kinase